MNKIKTLVLISFLLLIAIIAGLGIQCFLYKLELDKAEKGITAQQINQKDLYFAKLLVEKILLGQGQVGFDDRLKLENAVRDLNDQQIFDQWQKFTQSASDSETQQAVGALFTLLLNKISY